MSINKPNPFNLQTKVQFELPAVGKVDFIIYIIRGQQVESIKAGRLTAGVHKIFWKPKNDMPSGAYFVRMILNDSHIKT